MPNEGEKLAAALHDPGIAEIMINEDGRVYAEKNGALERLDVSLSEADLSSFLKSLGPAAAGLGPKRPYADLSAPDGSRVHLIGPPLTRRGICVTVRRRPARRPGLDEIVASGTLSSSCAAFLRYAVSERRNILIAGGTSSGKTTLLNALASIFPPGERVLVLEDTPELTLPQPHVVYLKTRMRDYGGEPDVALRDLLVNALRMRPDRLVVGECRGPESWDMLQAMNVGHDGVMSTLHANSARETLQRLETLILMTGIDLPIRAARGQIALALDLIVFMARLGDGSRRVLSVAEITGIETDVITMAELFSAQPRPKGELLDIEIRPTGTIPRFYDEIRKRGQTPPLGFFKA